MVDSSDEHLKSMVKAIVDGRLVPFLGAGVNLCDRPGNVDWRPGQREFLPSGRELSAHLQQSFGAPAENASDLSRVSQYVSVMSGDGPLYEELRNIFDANYASTQVHTFLARLPGRLRVKGYPRWHLLIVTTNYDDVLERAFLDAGEEFDLLTYIATGPDCGKFAHWKPTLGPKVIEIPDQYRELNVDRRSIILKIHGAVDRANAENDSFVITEDHYIDYLKHTELSSLVPPTVAAKLRRANLLFLGYGLRDWNLRVILDRLSDEQKHSYQSWAILLDPEPLDQKFWRRRDVEILDMPLGTYLSRLEELLDALPAVANAATERARG